MQKNNNSVNKTNLNTQQRSERTSLLRYMLGSLLLLIFIIAASLSFQSAYYMINAFDIASSANIQRIAREEVIEPGQPRELYGFHLSTDWQEVSAQIRDRFPSAPQQLNKIEVIFEDWIFIAPPGKTFAVMKTKDKAGNVIYASSQSEREFTNPIHFSNGELHVDPVVRIIAVGMMTIVIFLILTLLLMKSVTTPIRRLHDWARSLQVEQLPDQKPDFRFQELNQLADIIHHSLQSAHTTLKREQEFLQFASHELRTPIAVLRSNSALLNKLSPNPEDRERDVRERIDRASRTMKSMTETLLWLSRENSDNTIQTEDIDLSELVTQSVNDLNYLLNGKNINLRIKTEIKVVSLPSDAVKILVNNFIRNAFQHASHGQIKINQQACRISITNDLSTYTVTPSDNHIGFGLGLKLCQKLADRFNWQLLNYETNVSHTACIDFCK